MDDKLLRKNYNCETAFITVKDRLIDLMMQMGVFFEVSRAYNMYHFEIVCNAYQAEIIDGVLCSDAIAEVRA